MPEQRVEPKKTILDPVDRASEILFGLIMALTFTCSISVAQAGESEVRTMLMGALGCNLAWGVIDGVFYLMARLVERGEGLMTLRAVRQTTDRRKHQEEDPSSWWGGMGDTQTEKERGQEHRRHRVA